MHTYTVEPLSNGSIGMDDFVHYREVVLFQRLDTEASFIHSECPLLGVHCMHSEGKVYYSLMYIVHTSVGDLIGAGHAYT